MRTIIKQGDQCPFTQVPNELLEDISLTDKERFLYCVLRSQKPDWEYFMSQVCQKYNITENLYYEGVKKLQDAGWLVKQQNIVDGNKFGGLIIVIYNTKQHQQVTEQLGNEPLPINSGTEKVPVRKKPPTNNTNDNNNTNLNNKYTSDFDEWWLAVPKKEGKPAAKKAYLARREEGVTREVLLQGITAYANKCRVEKTESKYIKHPQGWLNRDEERWLSNYTPSKKAGFKSTYDIAADERRWMDQKRRQNASKPENLIADLAKHLRTG